MRQFYQPFLIPCCSCVGAGLMSKQLAFQKFFCESAAVNCDE